MPSMARVNTSLPELPHDTQDGHRYDKSDEWIGKREAEVYAHGSEKHGQACQPIDAGVMAIGDERSASRSPCQR